MEDTLDLIKNYLNQHLDNPPGEVTVDSRLDEIGVDSLGLIELIFEMEEKYKINVPQDLEKPETIGQLIGIVEKYKPAASND